MKELNAIRDLARKWRKLPTTLGQRRKVGQECADELEALLPALVQQIEAHNAALWNEALEEAAKGFENLYWGIHSNQEAADAVRALKREKRGGE